MNLFGSISNGIKGHFDKKNQYREAMDNLQRQADNEKLIAFKEEFSKNAKEVAIAEAKQDAADLSGLRKLRATNRARHLSHQQVEPGTFFDKLGDWTKKNKARMNENLARTSEVRGVAERERLKNLNKRISDRENKMQPKKQIGKSTWRM